jgi:soluble lytic murein transglycosylase-like protein
MRFSTLAGSLLGAAWVLTSAAAQAQDAARPGFRSSPALPNPVEAPITQLCARARQGDAESLNQLAWAYAYGKGTERNDAYASYLFYAASTAGHDGAKRMLHSMSWPAAEIPPCLTEVPAADPITRSDPPPHIDQLVRSLAPKYELDPVLVLSVIEVESNFNPSALSPRNAMGLMQLIPETAQRFGVRKPFEIRDNIQGGMAYLRWLLAYFEGDLSLVTAAYNAGEGAVDKYRGIPPFAETQDYVRKVIGRFGAARHPFDAKVVAPSAALKAPAASAPSPAPQSAIIRASATSATAAPSESTPATKPRSRRSAERAARAASATTSKVADAQALGRKP